jgi:hypothetical protein
MTAGVGEQLRRHASRWKTLSVIFLGIHPFSSNAHRSTVPMGRGTRVEPLPWSLPHILGRGVRKGT